MAHEHDRLRAAENTDAQTCLQGAPQQMVMLDEKQWMKTWRGGLKD